MKKYLVLILLFLVAGASAQNLIIENASIINVETGKLLYDKHILIEDGKIIKISKRKILNTSKYPILNAQNKYLIPGMIDTHIHFFQTGSLYTRPDALNMTDVVPYEEEIDFAFNTLTTDSFKRYLRLGITTVMDVGGPFSNFSIRDSIATKHVSPNVYLTGPLFSPYQPAAFAPLKDTPIAKINSVEEATVLFNKMLPFKPDFIKIWYIANPEMPAEQTYPIIEHIAQLAHKSQLKLAVHATQLNTAMLAVRAGADILVHSVDDVAVTEEFAQLLKEKEVTYIPTLIVSKNYYTSFMGNPSNHYQDLFFGNPKVYRSLTDAQRYTNETRPEILKPYSGDPTPFINYFEKNTALMHKNLAFLQDRGVNIAVGTDAGNIGTLHASSFIQEIEAMEQGNLTNLQLLKAATINAAKGFGLESKLGSITEGKIADILILNNNPLDNIQHLNAITTIIKDGKPLPIETIIDESSEQIVQRQVNAYNARNIEAFIDTYADDIEILNFPNEPSIKGKENLKNQFAQMFERVPNLYCEIKNRIVLGNKVVDREHVRFGERYSDVIAIYEVTNGKISKVTFLR